MRLIEGDWVYLIEDSGWNLKIGSSNNLYRRLYQYRDTARYHVKMIQPPCWVLGVRPAKRQEELEFHKAHRNEAMHSEWYPFKSRAGALLLLQEWQEPPMKNRVIWWGEGPHYQMIHNRTPSETAMLLSMARKEQKGPDIVLYPCDYCGVKYSARRVRQHKAICKLRPAKLPRPGAKGLVRNPKGRTKKKPTA
jgi:hypothetical protein